MLRVFVSSTVHDLVDLRAELEEDLRAMGAIPLLSDSALSDFHPSFEPTDSAIFSCLEQLRSADIVLFVLSQRYGPKLELGYGNLSATHLEYREALKEHKKKMFFIRNDLIGDYSSWKKNGKLSTFKPVWASKEQMLSLFGFIEEHKDLKENIPGTDQQNWYTPFKTSVDLKQIIRHRLNAQVQQATAEKLISNGKMPIVLVSSYHIEKISVEQITDIFFYLRFKFTLANAGPLPALSLRVHINFGNNVKYGNNDMKASMLLPGNVPANISMDIPNTLLKGAFDNLDWNGNEYPIVVSVVYSTPTGHLLSDDSEVPLSVSSIGDFFGPSPSYPSTLNGTGGTTYLRKTVIGYKNFLTRDYVQFAPIRSNATIEVQASNQLSPTSTVKVE